LDQHTTSSGRNREALLSMNSSHPKSLWS
jgi:hypothetical protein